jgi:hypothetical protein
MAKTNGQGMCGVCGRRVKEGLPRLTPYNLPVPTGDSYVVRQEKLCGECKKVIQDLTKRKIVEIGCFVEDMRKQFRKARFE